MTDQNSANSANQPSQKNQSRPKTAALVSEQTGEQIELARPSPELRSAGGVNPQNVLKGLLQGSGGAFGQGSFERQVSWLGDPRLQTAQRQALATEIGRVQGNHHLQCVVGKFKSAKRKGPANSELPPSPNHNGQVMIIQAKLTVNPPDDVYEQEANRLADAVLRMPEPDPSLSASLSSEETIQAEHASVDIPKVTPDLESRIQTLKGGGQQLPLADRNFFESRFGQDFSQVRLHTDSHAAQLSRELGAKAFTVGNDVVFGVGQYTPETTDGRHLIAHELTHVLQQGASAPIPKRIQRFEAQHHEHVERGALTQPTGGGGPGFSDAEASATYFGNWGRDMSQAFSHNPITDIFGRELIFEILNMLAISKFGRELNPKDFGVYSPREHIDNPAGQTNKDLLKAGERGFSQFKEGMQIDQPGKPGPDEDISTEETVNKLFTVNDAGLPAYLGRSIQYIEEEFSEAANLGRTQDGLMHFGNGLHTVEDLYAHSNFIEIGVGELYNSGALKLDLDLTKKLEDRKQAGLDAVETLSGKIADPKRKDKARPIMTTGSFVTADTMISLSEAMTAFFAEIDPFSASNAAKSQQTIQMIFARYEKLAASGDAGRIIQPFLTNFGNLLANELAKKAEAAIAGEGAKKGEGGEEPSWRDRVVATARGVAGKAVGGVLSLGGQLMGSDWVKEKVASAINNFGQLPLVDIHKFIMNEVSAFKKFFQDIDQKLQNLPFYNELKGFIKEQIESLREALKPIIKKAFAFVGELIQVAFAEAQVSATNIQSQINEKIYGAVKNPEKRAELDKASPEQKMAMLKDPNWCAQAGIAEDEMEQLKARTELDDIPYEEQKKKLQDPEWQKKAGLPEREAEQLRQMLQTPEYVKAGPSHSQIAKDHADSPFFGAAAVLAGSADATLRDKMITVWESEGKNTQTDPALQQNYAGEIPPDLQKRRPSPDKPENQWTEDEKRAEREAQKKSFHYKDLKRREEGEELLRQGGIAEGEEEHGAEKAYDDLVKLIKELVQQAMALPTRLRQLATRLETAAPDTAAELRNLANQLPCGLENIVDQIEGAANGAQMKSVAERLRKLAREKEGLIKLAGAILSSAAGRVEGLDPEFEAVAEELRNLAGPIEKLMPQVSNVLQQIAAFLEERGNRKLRDQAQLDQVHGLAPVKTGQWDPEMAKSHAQAGSPQRQALFQYLRQEIFAHPYDSTWWKPVLLAWCNSNKERLEAYIIARNEGDMHHHH